MKVGNRKKDFEMIKTLGKGHFGSVFLVKSKLDGKQYTMKELNSPDIMKLKKEIGILKQLNHPKVVRYFNSFQENEKFYIVIEFIDDSTLDKLIKEKKVQKEFIEEKKIMQMFTRYSQEFNISIKLKILYTEI